MFEKDRLFASLVFLLSIVAFVFVASNFSMTLVAPVSGSKPGSTITYKGISCVYLNGQLWECSENLFTRKGQNLTREALLGGGNVIRNATEFIAVGNASDSVIRSANGVVGQSLLGEYTARNSTCGLTRAAGTIRNVTGGCTESSCAGNWSIMNEFTSTCDSTLVNTTGLYADDYTVDNNTLFAENNFTSATLQTNDKINVTWFVFVT